MSFGRAAPDLSASQAASGGFRSIHDFDDEPGPSRQRGSIRRPGVGGDDAIRSTDDDALVSRISAVDLGYLDDPFASMLQTRSRSARTAYAPLGSSADGPFGRSMPPPRLGHTAGESRRPPVINIGTHHRTYAIDTILDRFLTSDAKGKGKQIVSLGAGSDTRFWRIRSNPALAHTLSKYVEIDFPHVTGPKARKIATNKQLRQALYPEEAGTTEQDVERKPRIGQGGTELESPLYSLLPLDLRQAAKNIALHAGEGDRNSSGGLSGVLPPSVLDPALPTLVIAECLFCYMHPTEGDAILGWFASTFQHCEVVVYEMHGMSDAFGQVMTRNLQTRGIVLPGATFDSPRDHADRLRRCGFIADSTSAYSLKEVRQSRIPRQELERISRLEHLDEIEELDLLLDHYTIAHGSNELAT